MDWQKHLTMYCTNPYWWNPFVCSPKDTLNANLIFNPLKELKGNCTEKNTYSEVWLITWFYFLHCLGYKLYVDFIFFLLSYISHACFADDALRKMSFKILSYDLYLKISLLKLCLLKPNCHVQYFFENMKFSLHFMYLPRFLIVYIIFQLYINF